MFHSLCFLVVVAAVFAQQPTDVRLSGGNSNAGAVEVLHEGQWGKVCADGFSVFDADVVCRQVTKAGLTRLENGNFNTPDPFVVEDLHCRGDETDVLTCQVEYGSTCSSGQAAGVTCGEGVTGTLGFEIGIIGGIAVCLVALIGIGALTVGCLYRNNCWRSTSLA